MAVEVEVVDTPLDYNILLGCNWTYTMMISMSSLFHVLCFPHKGKVVTIDQLSFTCSSSSASAGPSIPIIYNSHKAIENIGFQKYHSLTP
jgi:hypothetical protein